MTKNIEVRFGNGVRGVTKSWAAGVVKKTLVLENAPETTVSVLLTDNKEIRRINKKFLKHDTATDVISFGAEEPGYLGDLVVSVEMARQTAEELKISFKEELARYLVHGTLHLLGYDDKKEKARKKMHARQEGILNVILRSGATKNLKARSFDSPSLRSGSLRMTGNS